MFRYLLAAVAALALILPAAAFAQCPAGAAGCNAPISAVPNLNLNQAIASQLALNAAAAQNSAASAASASAGSSAAASSAAPTLAPASSSAAFLLPAPTVLVAQSQPVVVASQPAFVTAVPVCATGNCNASASSSGSGLFARVFRGRGQTATSRSFAVSKTTTR
jgi:hypothetical protein